FHGRRQRTLAAGEQFGLGNEGHFGFLEVRELTAELLSELRASVVQAAELEAGLLGQEAVAELFDAVFFGIEILMALRDITFKIGDFDFLLGDEPDVLMEFGANTVEEIAGSLQFELNGDVFLYGGANLVERSADVAAEIGAKCQAAEHCRRASCNRANLDHFPKHVSLSFE